MHNKSYVERELLLFEGQQRIRLKFNLIKELAKLIANLFTIELIKFKK